MEEKLVNCEFLIDEYHESNANRYILLEKLGEGTFGEVKKAIEKLSGNVVAIKYVRNMSKKCGITKSLFREMQILKSLDSLYIIKLYDVFINESNLCLVMEYVASDLGEIISSLVGKEYLSRIQIKTIYQMLFEAITHCHSKNIIHRDIKPSKYKYHLLNYNIRICKDLLITSKGIVKLADFGLARIYCSSDDNNSNNNNDINTNGCMSHQVATRYYRAPELLFASRNYDFKVDIWAIGVVMGELLTLKTLFPGNNDIDQMYKVFQVLGTPNPKTWHDIESLPDYSKVTFPYMKPLDLSLIMPNAHLKDIEFVSLSLKLNPSERINGKDALTNIYFQENPLPSNSAIFIPVHNNNNEKCINSKLDKKPNMIFNDIVNNLFIND